MGSNQQPSQPPRRFPSIPPTPENFVLGAAVLFLLAAVILAVFFSIGDEGGDTPTATAIVQSTDVAIRATEAGVPTVAGVYPPPVIATVSSNPYPNPNETTPIAVAPTLDASATAAAFATAQSGPTSSVPTFDPGNIQPTAGSGYPVPFQPTTQGTQPTLQPTRPAPTTQPVPTIQPTQAPVVTQAPVITQAPVVTQAPAVPATARPAATAQPEPTPAPPTAIPIDIVRGTVVWQASQSPIVVRRDMQIAPGATLAIEPGTVVQIAPGAAIYVDGKLYASGQQGNPVRFVSPGGGRWDAIYGRPGSDIGLDYVEMSGGGNGGTLISSEGGNLSILRSRLRNNGGQIRAQDSRLDMRETEVSGNDMPYGAAVAATYDVGGGVTLLGNRIGSNQLAAGAPPVELRNQSPYDTLNVQVQGNLMVGGSGPAMVIYTDGGLLGDLSCNALLNGTDGLMIKSGLLQVAPQVALTIQNNAIEDQTPPIIPEYLEYGIGRGASSDLYIDMRNNWWRSELGPYHPDLHADGRGEAAGSNIEFSPWLTERPACAPAHP